MPTELLSLDVAGPEMLGLHDVAAMISMKTLSSGGNACTHVSATGGTYVCTSVRNVRTGKYT